MSSVRELVRLAVRLQGTYERRLTHAEKERQADWERVEQRYGEVRKQRELIERVQAHGWQFSVLNQQRHLAAAINTCSEALCDMAGIAYTDSGAQGSFCRVAVHSG
jgi:hypothetical protein